MVLSKVDYYSTNSIRFGFVISEFLTIENITILIVAAKKHQTETT